MINSDQTPEYSLDVKSMAEHKERLARFQSYMESIDKHFQFRGLSLLTLEEKDDMKSCFNVITNIIPGISRIEPGIAVMCAAEARPEIRPGRKVLSKTQAHAIVDSLSEVGKRLGYTDVTISAKFLVDLERILDNLPVLNEGMTSECIVTLKRIIDAIRVASGGFDIIKNDEGDRRK